MKTIPYLDTIEHPKLGTIAVGDDVLIRHPEIGSKWIEVTGLPPGADLVEGKYLDIWPPSSYLPDGLIMDWEWTCFLLSCVFKVDRKEVD